jgi:hypothetical protein
MVNGPLTLKFINLDARQGAAMGASSLIPQLLVHRP